MKQEQQAEKMKEIIEQLDELCERDLAMIRLESSRGVGFAEHVSSELHERTEERRRLHEQLRGFVFNPVYESLLEQYLREPIYQCRYLTHGGKIVR